MENNQKKILITGASSGLGRETAIRLAKEGHIVFAGVRKKVDKVEIENLSTNIKGVYIDVTDSSSIEKAFWYVMKNTDKLDVLVNNAGIVVASPIEFISIKDLKEQFNVNTFGPIMVAQKFMPLLSNGRIVNISSMASTGLFPFISPYGASKRALDIMFNSFFIENKDNVKVVSIRAASIKTPIWNKSVNRAKESFSNLSEIAKNKYKKELDFLEKNALKNNTIAIESCVAVDKIVDIILEKNPKQVYWIGFQALLSELLSKLPQNFVNRIIKTKLEKL